MKFRKMVTITLYARQKETQMYRTDFWTLWEKVRVGWSERTALKHVCYQVWNRLPVQIGCMRQVLGAGALGWPKGMGWGGRWEGSSGCGTNVNPWLIHVNVWQKPLQYCKVISLQLIKINEKKKKKKNLSLWNYSKKLHRKEHFWTYFMKPDTKTRQIYGKKKKTSGQYQRFTQRQKSLT